MKNGKIYDLSLPYQFFLYKITTAHIQLIDYLVAHLYQSGINV